jgi:hypothetical protein
VVLGERFHKKAESSAPRSNMNVKELAEIFLRERREGAPCDNSPMSSEWRNVGTAAWLAGATVEEARRGGWRVVLSARTAHLRDGAAPADGRNLRASVGAVYSRPDLGGKGRIPGAWRSGSRGQFVAAAVYGFKTRREAAEALAKAVEEIGGSGAAKSLRHVLAQDSAKEDHEASFPKLASIAEAKAKAAGWTTWRRDETATLYAEPSEGDWQHRLSLKGDRWVWFQSIDEPLPDWAREPII